MKRNRSTLYLNLKTREEFLSTAPFNKTERNVTIGNYVWYLFIYVIRYVSTYRAARFCKHSRRYAAMARERRISIKITSAELYQRRNVKRIILLKLVLNSDQINSIVMTSSYSTT